MGSKFEGAVYSVLEGSTPPHFHMIHLEKEKNSLPMKYFKKKQNELTEINTIKAPVRYSPAFCTFKDSNICR